MPTSSRRAVFTCLGIHTPIGTDPDSYFQALSAGTSGIRPLSAYTQAPMNCRIGGTIDGYDSKKFIPATMREARKAVGRLSRTVQLGVTAAQQAMTSGGPAPGSIDPFRFGIEYACVMISTELEDIVGGAKLAVEGVPLGKVDMRAWGKTGLKQVPPLWMLKYLPNMPACHASINADAQGPNNTHTATDIAGLMALGEAYRILQRDAADFFLVGGCESRLNPLSISRTSLFMELAKSFNDDPARAVRPFDAAREGTVLGEAAAVLGLEELATAEQRGAKILAELVGFASGFEASKKGTGFAGVIRNAMKQANIGPEQIDHVNAAAGGWRELDAWEARAIQEVFGDAVPVFAAKGHIGNSGAASALVELAASVLALRDGVLPGTLNCENRAPDCPVLVHTGAPRPVEKPYALKLSFTDMGQCAAAIIRKW